MVFWIFRLIGRKWTGRLILGFLLFAMVGGCLHNAGS